jgi:hypothetical protein
MVCSQPVGIFPNWFPVLMRESRIAIATGRSRVASQTPTQYLLLVQKASFTTCFRNGIVVIVLKWFK